MTIWKIQRAEDTKSILFIQKQVLGKLKQLRGNAIQESIGGIL